MKTAREKGIQYNAVDAVQSSAVYWSNTIDTVEIPNFGALPYLANSKLREASKG